MKLALVAAMARGRVIGKDNRMPWHMPADLRHFRRLTMGHPILMGRRTFESIGRPLPGRRNLVLTRRADFAADGVEVVRSLAQAMALCGDSDILMVIGGGQLYEMTIADADILHLTFIDACLTGDTWFPDYHCHGPWQETERQCFQADEENPHDYCFVTFKRLEKSRRGR